MDENLPCKILTFQVKGSGNKIKSKLRCPNDDCKILKLEIWQQKTHNIKGNNINILEEYCIYLFSNI
jgi:hypothetical protein